MKTRAALALTVAGIFLTGGAAFAATQTLSTPGTGTTDDAPNIVVADDSAARTPAPAVTTAKPTAKTTDDTNADDRKAARKTTKPPQPGEHNRRQPSTSQPRHHNRGYPAAPAENIVRSR
jgi:hypothetical protein